MQQLTYGSADGIPGRVAQGWGVLRRAGDQDAAIEEALIDGVSVSLPATVPKFPSSTDLAARPVRLRYSPGSGSGAGLWWRSVEAGPDHTQRPGNVFTHAVASAVPAGSRPADFALAREWLAPFGADQVRDATPSGEFSLPEDPDGRGIAAVLRWLHSASGPSVHWVPWVVDVVIQALLADTRVLMRGLSPDQAWGWISLVTWLLPAHAGQLLGFSTHEDGASLAKAFDLDIRVAAYPGDARLPALPHPVLEVDVTAPVDVEDAMRSGVWQLPDGTTAPVTAWAMAVRDLIWLDPASARAVLEFRDHIVEPLMDEPRPYAEQASLAVRLGLLATPGAVIMGRAEALRSVLCDEGMPAALWSHPLIAPLVAEAGLAPHPEAAEAVVSGQPDGEAPPESSPAPPVSSAHQEPSTQMAHTVSVEALGELFGGDHTGPIDVALVKNTPDLHAHPDRLDTFPFPCPASLLPAATMVARYCPLDNLSDPALWVPLVLTLPPLGRLAMLHCIAQAPPTPLSDDDIGRLMTALESDPHLDRYLSPVLLLLLGVEAHRAQPLVDTEQGPSWLHHLADFTGRLDAREASYLQVPFLETVHYADTANTDLRRACRERISRWSKDQAPVGLWSLRIADGRTLATLVSQAVHPEPPALRSL